MLNSEDAFHRVCREHFKSMRESDMDYDAMRQVVALAEKGQIAQVFRFTRAYNETYFSELIQILYERATRCQPTTVPQKTIWN